MTFLKNFWSGLSFQDKSSCVSATAVTTAVVLLLCCVWNVDDAKHEQRKRIQMEEELIQHQIKMLKLQVEKRELETEVENPGYIAVALKSD